MQLAGDKEPLSDTHFCWSKVTDQLKSLKTNCSKPPQDPCPIKIQFWWLRVPLFLRCCRQACYHFSTKFRPQVSIKHRYVDMCIPTERALHFAWSKQPWIVHSYRSKSNFISGNHSFKRRRFFRHVQRHYRWNFVVSFSGLSVPKNTRHLHRLVVVVVPVYVAIKDTKLIFFFLFFCKSLQVCLLGVADSPVKTRWNMGKQLNWHWVRQPELQVVSTYRVEADNISA